MRLHPKFFLVFLILVEILMLVEILKPVESFVTIPAPVAFAIITAAVKLKLILVKIMFAMRTMGKFHLLKKREAGDYPGPTTTSSSPESLDLADVSQNELLAAWNELEQEAERHIHFDLDSCVLAAITTTNTSTTTSIDDSRNRRSTEEDSRDATHARGMSGWRPIARPRVRSTTTTTTTTEAPDTEIEINEDEEYAKMISSLIGTMTKSFQACHILKEGLISSGRDGMEDGQQS